jgi:chromosome segregation ATPase
MRWLVSFALLLWFSSASSWASSSSSTAQLPEASEGGSPSLKPTWERLDDLLRRLESSAEDSSSGSRLLRDSLEDARERLTELSARLTESSTRASELSSSLERCERSLALSESSLREARAASARRELELRLWRWAAVVGLAAGVAGTGWALAGAASR